MLCFRCRNEMQKTVFDGVLVDYCPECRGFWLDAGEFELALKEEDVDTQTLWKKAQQENLQESIACAQTGKCPSCLMGDMKMVKRDDIDVDECDQCHGIFFDKDELSKCHEKQKKWYLKIMRHIMDMF